jgi:hypothetical protein
MSFRLAPPRKSAITANIRLASGPFAYQPHGMNATTQHPQVPSPAAARLSRTLSGILAVRTAILLLLTLPVAARGADLTDLLSGKTIPLTVTLGGLDKSWRRITLPAAGSASGNISISVTVGGTSGGTSGSSQNNVADLPGSHSYLTTGQTVTAHGEVYLVAYRLPGAGLDLSALIQAIATKAPPATSTLTPDSTLSLSLLDVKSVGNLEEIRPFDLNREIAESEKLSRTIAATLKAAGGTGTNSPPASPDKSGK